MDLMKIRIHFFKDMNNHTYFFKDPIYENAIAEKFLTKLKQPNEVKCKILRDISSIIKAIEKFDTA